VSLSQPRTSSTEPPPASAAEPATVQAVGRVFLEHYVPCWERRPDPAEWWEIR
jgi:hypothetical protein